MGWEGTDPNLRVVRLGVHHSPAVLSVGGWDENMNSIPFLSKAEMRVFLWMPRRSLISCGDTCLTLLSARTLAHGVGHAYLSRQTLVCLALWVYEFALCSKSFHLFLRTNKGGATKELVRPFLPPQMSSTHPVSHCPTRVTEL